MSTVTRCWWVRHAPVTADGGRVYGQSDIDCDTSDDAAFRGLAAILPRDAVWVASQLRRTHQTAAAIRAAGLSAPEPLIEPDLAEQHLGDWQGRDRAEVFAENSDWRGFWIAPAHNAPPGGESFADLMGRVVPAVDRLVAAHGGRDLVLVAHGGTIRAAIAQALGLPPEGAMAFVVDNLSVTQIDHIAHPAGGDHAWRVGTINRPPV